MVAVFTGNGLGLYNTSYTQLGTTFGSNAGIGQSRESQYVNLATGNLVLKDLDESLLVRGMNAAFLRTYNSRGLVAGTGQDGWVTGFERSVALTGTLNAAGSTMTLNTGDGQSVVFVWSGTANLYTSTGGEGAHDTLTWNATTSQWTYVEGSSRREELYEDHANATLKGRLARIRDLKTDGTTPAQFDIVYDASNRVSEVRSIDGAVLSVNRDAMVFTYNTAGQLASISTREGGTVRSQVTYGYENADGSGRLAWVQTDLTPDVSADNTWDGATAANNDGKRYRTSYTYASATASDLRIAGVTTSDGVSIAYTYETDGAGGYRVKTVTQGSAVDGSAQTTTFTYGAGTTDVADGAGRTWTYQFDAAGQLSAVLEPAVDGLRQKTSYTYDAAGNVVRISQAPSAGASAVLDTVFRYDANGNRILQRDLLGNTIEWTYNAANQVTAEIRYTVADADGLDPNHAGTTNLPSGALTTRYIYDSSNRVRFVLDPTGLVREVTYATSGNGIGQIATERVYLGAAYTDTVYTEAALNAWASDGTAMRRANSKLTVNSYDAKGRMSQSETYATVTGDANGTGVLDAATDLVRYTYDAQGLLRQRITVRGAGRSLAAAAPAASEIVDFVYDGMGRLLTQLSRAASTAAMPDARTDAAGYATWLAANDGATLLTVYAYADSGSQIRVTTDAGATRTTAFNKAGAIGTVSESGTVGGTLVTRTTQNWYDASGRLRASQDANGGRSYYFYDGAGRLSAVVDATGAVTRTVYDGVGRVVQQIAYARTVATAGWLSGSTVTKDTLIFAATAPALAANQAWVQTDAANDRAGSRSYDASGRIATQTDASGLLTTYAYDAADRLLSTTVSKPGDATAVPRVTRYFYDAANRVVATLDAEGYLAESIYDAGGRLVRQVRYITPTRVDLRAAGTLSQLRPAVNPNDQSTRYFYNARNLLVGSLDAEGYLTENVYDEAANQRAVKAYAKQLTGLAGSETLAALKTLATTAAPAEAFRLTQRSFNALGQVTTEQDYQGTVTNYVYDEAGRLVKTQAAAGTSEVREGNLRYDVFGNLIGELGGEGSTRLLTGMSEAQIDAVYAQYGSRHSYDLAGRRIETIDAAGNRTWYFYDAAGRRTFVVRGVHDAANVQNAQGEVAETRYNAFGDVTDVVAYTGRITLATPGSRASAQSAIATLAFNATVDSRVQQRYDQRGLVTERIDAEGYRTLYGYTAFGELRTQQDLELDNSVRRTLTSTYDNRGLTTAQSEAGGALNRSVGTVYDAFGRAVTRIDARGTSTTLTYDRLGRQLGQTVNGVSGRNESVSMTYDAFGRTLTRTDALGRTTTFVHSDSARSMTVISQEGVTVTTARNRFGQEVTVSQTLPDGTVATNTTSYNKDGQVTGVLDPLNRSVGNSYDARGLLVATVDGSNRRIEYTYDAAGRVLTRREDPTGLNLVTTYAYDGQGRQVTVTDGSGLKTTLNYDRKGQLVETILDPNGLALRTTFVRDRDGREVTVTSGAGTAAATVIAYAYDAFGRRTSETVSPGVLNLVTSYTYDANDNVVRKTDASNRTTRYSYDAANRMRFSVDDAGSVSEVVYDANGRATMTRRYAKAANIAALAAAPSEADVAALVVAQLLENDAKDEVVYRIYDRDGRLIMSVDGAGAVTDIHYDTAGRKTTERRYAQPATLAAPLRAQLKTGAATADTVRALVATDPARDVVVRYVYDAAGEVAFTLDAVGAVTRTWFDGAGRTVAVRRYATAVNPAGVTDATTVSALQALVADSAADVGEYRVYDAAGRVAYTIDLAGSVRQVAYDNAGRIVLTRAYAATATLTAAQRDALRAGTATVADFSAFATANEATSRVQATVYDSAGRARFTVSRTEGGLAEVAESQYDAAGRIVVQQRYGVAIAFSAAYTETTIGTALNAALSGNATIRATQIRSQRYVYDAAGRQHFVIDASGALAEWRYDGAGRVTDTLLYGQRPPAATITESGLNAWASSQLPADVRRTRSSYDAAGRLQTKTDANNVSETYAYDGLGRMLTRIDRNNSTWTYEYDAAGRRTAEISPQVQIASVAANGMVSVETRSVVTRFTFDALGNVLTRIDNADAPITTDRRTTRYVYDNRGFQVSTIFPDAGAWNVTTGALEATGVQATIEITYNALGQAVVQKDVRNNYTYKTYDAAGRLSSEVDAEGYISGYTYNGFGEVSTLRRYDTRINTTPLAGWTAGQPLTLAQMQTAGVVTTGPSDRVITTTYTAMGRQASVAQSAITYYRADGSSATGTPTRALAYNAFGDLVQESDLLQGTAGTADAVWTTTTRYYDALGRNTLTVDAEGYATATAYNATGEATETIEYARALTGTIDPNARPGLPAPGDATVGYDRISRWTYDALGRKSTETAVRQYRRTDGSTGTRNVVATYGYDNEGRLTSIADDTGTTTTTYDAAGRTLSVQEPARSVVVAGADGVLGNSASQDLTSAALYETRSPYTTMAYDAFGNAVMVRRYANGRNGTAAAVADDGRDQIQLMRYDWQGRAVWERNGEGATVTRRYDAADNVLEVAYALQGNGGRSYAVRVVNTYDKVGHQLTTRTERDTLLSGAYQNTAIDAGETVSYNAFGEINTKTVQGLGGMLVYGYDAAGRMVSTNESGATRSLGYNLAGHMVRSAQTVYLGAAEGTTLAVTTMRTDRLGRTLSTTMPSYTTSLATTASITQTVDRWGNVLRIVDARGYQTDYEYNSLNQLTRETRPLVKVVSEAGVVTWQRPVVERYYDALGRMVATRDANGNLKTSEFDATGRLVASRDAFGNATRYAYDALGNQRLSQNPLGYLSFKEYDRNGRVVAIGDYLPSATGTTRTKSVQQTYTLNANGDRVVVTDSLNAQSLYDYDSRNQLLRSQTPEGVVMQYAYDAGGHKIRESNALSANSGTLVDRDGETVRINELTWDYDVFGRLVDHNNLSGRDSNYVYDAASGMLVQETASGGQGITTGDGSRVTSYYANGKVRLMVEGATSYRYEYDAAGNRTVEEVTTADTYGMSVHTLTRTTYDSNNRVERVTQDDLVASKRIFDLLTEYDANGNRRHVVALSGYGPNVSGIGVTNNAPVVIRGVDNRTVRKGVNAQFRLLFTDIFRDAEQDALSLSISQADGSALPAWLTVTRDPVTGELVFNAAPGAALADQDIVVKLTASETANPGNATSTTFTVSVRANSAPTLAEAGDISLRVKTGQPWSKDLVAGDYFRDVDVGDVLALSIENPASLPAWLTVDAGNPGAIRLSGTPNVSGSFTLRLRATDQSGAYVVKQFNITTAPNSAPQVVAVPAPVDAILNRQFDWTRSLASVFSDLEGDRMQVTARLSDGSALPSWMSFQYLYDQATPQLKFTGNVPASEVDGRVYNIVMTATDADGAASTTTLTVRVFANRAPAPTAGTLTLPALRVNDTYSQTFALSSLFVDPENDALDLAAVWPNGSTLPQWLRMTVDYTAKTVTFSGRPTSNAQAGTLAFDVRATDIAGLTGTKSFSLTIGTDTAPARTAVAAPDTTASIGRTFSYTLPAGMFADADGDAITLSAQMVTQYTETYWEDTIPPSQITINSVTYAALPAWMTFNAATRTISGTVPANQPAGPIVVRIKATDSRGRVSAADERFVGGAGNAADGDIVFNVQPWTNTAPVYNGGLANQTMVHGGAVNIALPGGAFTEPDGDALTYIAEVYNGTAWVNISTIGLSINATTGQITGTASNLVRTSYSARIRARDPQGLEGIGSFTITVTNTAPVAGTIPAQTAGRNQAFSLNAAAYFSDVNADALSFTATGLPAGLTISSAGVVSGSATAALGAYTVTVTASDGRGGTASTSFTLTVANSAPIAPVIPNQTATANTAWSYVAPAFTDPNGDALTYSASGLPAWMSFNAATRTFSGTAGPVGSWTITVSASDGTVSSSASFTVTTPSAPPVYTAGSLVNQTAQPSQGFSYTIPANTFTDPNGDALTYSADGNGAALPSWLSFNAATRTFSGTPTTAGTWTIRVLAYDGTTQVGATFTISTPNVGPVYNNSLPARGANIGAAVSWTLPAGAFTDPNNDALSYTLEVERPGYWETYLIAPGEPDVRWIDPAWVPASSVGLSIAANGTISGTMQALYAPKDYGGYTYYYGYNMRIVARDPSTASVAGSFAVTANAAPTAPAVTNIVLAYNTPVSTTLPAFNDLNAGQALTYSASNLPPGLSFNAATRTISGTGTLKGDWVVTYTATDPFGASASTTFTLTVGTDTAPVRTGVALADTTASIGRVFSYTIPDGLFVDNDGDSFALSAQMVTQQSETYWEDTVPPTQVTNYWVTYSALPAWMSFNPATRTFSGTVPANQPAGPIVVRLKATDSRGRVSVANESRVGYAGVTSDGDIVFNVQTWTNTAPVYNAGTLPNRTLVHGGAVSFALPGGAFTEPDGDALSYSAQVLIGSTWTSISALGLSINASTGLISGTAVNLTQTSYSARIVASDPQGATGTGTFTFSVTNTAPTAGTIPSQTAGRNQAFSLNAAAYFSDVNADALSFTATGLPAGLTISSAGAISGASTAALGAYTVTVTANDGRGGTVSSAFTLTVANSAPVAPSVPNQTATGGVAWSYTAAAFSDPNGDALSYSASGLPAWMSFNAATRTFSGTPGVTGSWTITYTATDTSGAATSTTFTVTTPSAPPVYNGTLSNQSASPGVGFSYTVPAGAFTDPNGDALTYSADANGVALPSWLSFNAATRTFSGTPSAAGTWTIRVMASDGTSTASGTFTISTANVGPVYNGTLPTRSAQSGTAVSWTLPAGAFTDANGDALSYTLELERPGYWELYYIAPGEPDYRWVDPVWISPSSVGLSIAANGTVSGTLQPLYAPRDYGGSMYYYNFNMRITARDPSSAAAVGTFAVVANAAPVAPAIGTLNARQNVAFGYTLAAFSDANGDALSYSVSNLPPGMTFDAATRTIGGTPTTAGNWTVTYTANDGRGSVTSTTFTLAVAANNAPVAPSVAAQTGSLNTALSIALPAFTDADYDALTYSASNLPTGLSFNAATRTISGTPTATGTWTVTYSANDGRGGVASTTFSFTISNVVQPNRAPVVSAPLADQYADSGIYFEYIFAPNSFTDPDGNPLTYTATQASGSALPSWLKFDAANRRFWGTPTGTTNQTITVRVVATDPSGLTAYDDFVLVKYGTGGGGGGQIPLMPRSNVNGAGASSPRAAAQADPNAAFDVYEAPTPVIGPVYALDVVADDGAIVAADDGAASAASAAAPVAAPAGQVFAFDMGASLTPTQASPVAGRTYTFDMGTSQAPTAVAPSASTTTASATQTLAVSDPATGDVATTQPVVNALAASVPVQVKDEWFVYDAENRLKLVGGQLVNGHIELASGVNSYELMYDAAGQVIGRGVQSGANHILYRTTYDLRGRKQYEFHAEYLNPVSFEFGGLSKQYVYDTADRLIETRSFYQNGSTVAAPKDGEGFPEGPPMSIAGWLANAETMSYDRDGRMTLQVSYARASGRAGITWMEPGTFDDTVQRTSLTVLAENSRVMYTDALGNSGYDALGRVSTYRYTAKEISWATHTYTSTYQGWEGYVEKFVQGVSSDANYRATTNTLTYDAFGRLVRQVENTPLPSNYGALYDRARAYTYNGDGRVLTRREGTIENGVFTQTADAYGARANFQFVHAAGQQQAELKEGGQIRYNNGYTYDTPQIQTLNGSGNYAAGGGTVTALQGETLQSLAQRVYGNSSQWYVLADANGLSDPDAPLIAGTQLNTPKVTVSSNDAGTFQPYNPADATGPTAPGMPYITPPPKKSCNPLAIVLMVVIAVVVTVFTAGVAAMAMGVTATATGATGVMAIGGAALTGSLAGATVAAGSMLAVAGATTIAAGSLAAVGGAMAAGFVGGFMGSVASQVVGKAMGVVDHFSLRSAFAGGLSGAFSAGIGATGVVGRLAGSGEYAHIARGAIGSAIGGVTSYAANRIAGLDVSFSWRSIAASAVAGALTAGINKSLGLVPGENEKLSDWAQFRNDLASGIVGGVASLHVRRAFGFNDRVDYGQIVADAFGNALGNAVVSRLQKASFEDQIEKFQKRIDSLRSTLPEGDRDNPLFYVLSDKIDPAIKRDLWARYQSGQITLDRVAANLGSATAAYDGSKGENGTIAINRASLELAQDKKFGGLMGAMVLWGDMQEVGHQLDQMAWNAMGQRDGDSPGDEGAMFAYMAVRGMQAKADPQTGLISHTMNFGGSSVTIQADSAMLGVIATHSLVSGAMFRENRVDGIEFFNAGGHYYSTFAIGYDTTLAATGDRGRAYDTAQKLALAAQLPDMVWALDAYSQFMNAGPYINEKEKGELTTVMSTLHNLAPEGKGTNAWLMKTREDAGRLVSEAIADGNYILAGFAIHKLGDSYAHIRMVKGQWVPYEAPGGHGLDSATGNDPDNIHAKPDMSRAYAKDLAGRIATGLGVSRENMSAVVTSGTSGWNAAFESSLTSQASKIYIGGDEMTPGEWVFSAEKGNEVFINAIIDYEKQVRGTSESGLEPGDHLHPQRSPIGSLAGLGSKPAIVQQDHYDLLFGKGVSNSIASSQIWDAYRIMLKRFEAFRK